MTPLEAVRWLQGADIFLRKHGEILEGDTTSDYRYWHTCVGCPEKQERAKDFPHAPTCPIGALPQVVAALEEQQDLYWRAYVALKNVLGVAQETMPSEDVRWDLVESVLNDLRRKALRGES